MKRVALLGMPNTGKSTLFNRLTGSHAKVGNWPGLTVELLNARLIVGDQVVRMVDLPGIYDLNGYSDDEKVVTHFLDTQATDLVIFVLNTSQYERQLHLLSQVMAKGIPMLVVMNMVDEASAMGITVDVDVLREKLQHPVHLLSAKYGQGMERLLPAVRQALTHSESLTHSASLPEVESAFQAAMRVPAQASHAVTEKLDKAYLPLANPCKTAQLGCSPNFVRWRWTLWARTCR
jgi:ferrous iron transport protein B